MPLPWKIQFLARISDSFDTAAMLAKPSRPCGWRLPSNDYGALESSVSEPLRNWLPITESNHLHLLTLPRALGLTEDAVASTVAQERHNAASAWYSVDFIAKSSHVGRPCRKRTRHLTLQPIGASFTLARTVVLCARTHERLSTNRIILLSCSLK